MRARRLTALGLAVLHALAHPPVVQRLPGGYPRATTLGNGTLVLAAERFPRCGIHATERVTGAWRQLPGPGFGASPGDQLANCYLGEAADGSLLMSARHHRACSGLACAAYRIQIARSLDYGHTWGEPVTVYATEDPMHAAWEPVLFKPPNSTVLQVAYSLERPRMWSPPACAPGTNYPGADLGPSARAASAATCQARCQAHELCQAWSWRRSDSECWLKRAGHGEQPTPTVDSGSKLCGAGSAGVWTAQLGAAKEQDLVVQESADGLSWGPVRAISHKQGSRDGMPSVRRQRDGCLVCVFEATDTGSFKSNSIRSCDDGKTWVRQAVSTPSQTSSGHAPTVALLSDGRAAVSSYTESNDIQLQFSGVPLSGTLDARWTDPRVVVTGLSRPGWPDVFTDNDRSRLWLAYANASEIVIVGPLASTDKND